MSTATLTSKGQVTIPKQVRDRLGLRRGDRIEFVMDERDESVRLRPVKVDIRDLFGMLKSDRHLTVDEMNAVIRERGGEQPR